MRRRRPLLRTLALAAVPACAAWAASPAAAHDGPPYPIFANRGGERFVEIGRESGVGRSAKSGMNGSFGDVFNDGRLSIYRTRISEPGALVQASDLWVPIATAGGGLRYEDLASTLGVDLGGWSWGAHARAAARAPWSSAWRSSRCCCASAR